ncbi:hypothetical protein E2562_028122 [Oryza meyeriana var. granulata]|uniref:Protein kinase domain-containing protein n=1 Tax=Oryza meyeriana var. granulata TaxID=110450 RepID=A0A6G1C832_9ORYZ|nr:hypothetical protein E2562_028122 [Oryza meyeriana var. granulata]
MELQRGVSARVNCDILNKKGLSGKSSQRSSDEAVSPRSVLDGGSITTAATTTTTEDSSYSAGTTATTTSTYSSYDDEPYTPPARHERQPWRGVAETWRSRTMRRLPSLAPTMSSTFRRLSIRSGAWQWQSAAAAPADGNQACALRPPIRTFSLSELKKATRNFSKENVVGRGGHAKVYRGCLPGGELVAVKRLSTAAAPDRGGRVESFLSELGHVVSLSHPNIARLVGVGVDGGEHLVFPFSRLGCLSGRLHGSGAGAVEEAMTWEARFRVAVGAARGLEYLHERCARRIVHRDVKPANILLKDDYEPMICDFGLAKWLPANMTHYQVTTFEGTFGYLPPEYTSHGIFNEKTDVFAYGVVLLELLTGRRAIDAKKLSLLTWARPFLYGGDGVGDDGDQAVRMMVDPALGGRYDGEQLARVARAAKLCIHTSPELRPKMSQVTRILQGDGEHRRSEGPGRTAMDHTVELHETNGQDSATRRQLDDLTRHKALAFDFEWEHTSSAEIEHLSVHSNYS